MKKSPSVAARSAFARRRSGIRTASFLCRKSTPDWRSSSGHCWTHPNFPKRTNVQFLKVLDRENIQIEIWERGAGNTLASGSSSSAAAAVAHKLRCCDRSITVHMPGGKISIEIGDGFSILMTGPVTKGSEGTVSEEIFA